MIKYKEHESPGWWYKIDINEETGKIVSKIPFNKKHGFYKEMIDSGIEIEPLYTPKELKDKKDEAALEVEQQIISAAKQWLVDNDFKYMQNIRRVSRGTITPEQETEFKTFLDEADKKAQLVPKSS